MMRLLVSVLKRYFLNSRMIFPPPPSAGPSASASSSLALPFPFFPTEIGSPCGSWNRTLYWPLDPNDPSMYPGVLPFNVTLRLRNLVMSVSFLKRSFPMTVCSSRTRLMDPTFCLFLKIFSRAISSLLLGSMVESTRPDSTIRHLFACTSVSRTEPMRRELAGAVTGRSKSTNAHCEPAGTSPDVGRSSSAEKYSLPKSKAEAAAEVSAAGGDAPEAEGGSVKKCTVAITVVCPTVM
mmetsp:Transcript_69787/g.145525  ORF Transcript_69787/g.145525 Transcript_69787/m.145525 type:complete len:237 (+) Transcript_69787:3-713(+)